MVAMFESARNKELEKFKHRQLSKAAEAAKGKAKLGVIDIQNGLRDCIQKRRDSHYCKQTGDLKKR